MLIISGVRGVTTIVVYDSLISKPTNYIPQKITGIQTLSNFMFASEPLNRNLKMWRAFNIGAGIQIQLTDNSYEQAWIERKTAKVMNSAEPGFIKTKVRMYVSNLLKFKVADNFSISLMVQYFELFLYVSGGK